VSDNPLPSTASLREAGQAIEEARAAGHGGEGERSKKLKINGALVEGRHELKDGDIVDVANIKMQFYIKE